MENFLKSKAYISLPGAIINVYPNLDINCNDAPYSKNCFSISKSENIIYLCSQVYINIFMNYNNKKKRQKKK